MRARFTVRLLDAAHNLLAWSDVIAEATPQDRAASCPFWPVGRTQFQIERDGRAEIVTIHWPDLDVARIQNIIEPLDVKVGQVANYEWLEPVWLVPGMRDVPLPAVTVKQSVRIEVPTGSLGVRDSRT